MIDLKRQGDLWTVTLNRPEKANALTAQMLERLIDIAGDAHGNAKVLVLTGAGSIFCAGADLDEARAGLAVSDLWETLSTAIANLPCMTVCALNGTLAGGAFGMALACDIRLSVPQTKFFYPVMRLGFLPQPSDAKRLTQLIGPARTKMILMAGEKIDAAEALSWGLIDRSVAPDQLDQAVHNLCAQVLQAEVSHIQAIKGLSSL
ncbi:enoyl-CoA hydratase/isomerase family protein [Pacificibacter marinus]|uniref:Putative enoyl-CoA hydratase echA6 n=1 Tax=Pacificibacter marinus TaxID=658057 RepID=A0A1Y5TDT4_9RHOB|nr:enoyl-CoA hydratase/isomerase family protein [Pacificibacter marinus]SEL13359.1 Enoyl-CoA hydratase/carnithine racemase [Pacificibacter marinus]SLN61336.1 putative enoyl-CoA hydratase echA6 [Pacificibacter marinus]